MPATFERVEIPAGLVAFARRRTRHDARDFVNFDRSLKDALAQAYVLGFIDAAGTLERSDAGSPGAGGE